MSSSDDEMPALQVDCRGGSGGGATRCDSSQRADSGAGGESSSGAFAESARASMSNQTSTFSTDFVSDFAPAVKKAEQVTKEAQTGVAWRVVAGKGSQQDSSTERVIYLNDLSLGVEHENFGWIPVKNSTPNAPGTFAFPTLPGASAISQVQNAITNTGTPLPPNDLTYCFLTPGVPTQSMFVAARTYESVISGRNSRYIAAAQDVARSLVHGDTVASKDNSSSSCPRSATLNSIGAHVQPAASQDTNHFNALFPRADVFSTFDAVSSRLAPRGASNTFVSSASANARPRQELQGTPSSASNQIATQIPITQRYHQQLQQELQEREQKLKEYHASQIVLDQTSTPFDGPFSGNAGGGGKKGKKGGAGKSADGKSPATCTISNLAGGGKTMSVNCGLDKMDHLIYATKCSFMNGGECILPGGKVLTALDLVAMGKDPSNLSDDFIRKLITSHANRNQNLNVLEQLQALNKTATANRRRK